MTKVELEELVADHINQANFSRCSHGVDLHFQQNLTYNQALFFSALFLGFRSKKQKTETLTEKKMPDRGLSKIKLFHVARSSRYVTRGSNLESETQKSRLLNIQWHIYNANLTGSAG